MIFLYQIWFKESSRGLQDCGSTRTRGKTLPDPLPAGQVVIVTDRVG